MERLTKRIIFGREVPTAALCNAPAEVCEGAKSCGSCDFLRDKIFQRLAAYEDTNHTPEECVAAFEELAAYRTDQLADYVFCTKLQQAGIDVEMTEEEM